MALFLSALVGDSEREPARFSLIPEAHIKIYRIGMFAMSQDQLTSSERQHLSGCVKCAEAFRLAVGVTDFTGPLNELRRGSTDSSAQESKKDHRAA
jgi:hypothetical protein